MDVPLSEDLSKKIRALDDLFQPPQEHGCRNPIDHAMIMGQTQMSHCAYRQLSLMHGRPWTDFSDPQDGILRWIDDWPHEVHIHLAPAGQGDQPGH